MQKRKKCKKLQQMQNKKIQVARTRSLIFAPIESTYVTSCWTTIVTLVLSYCVSGILELLYAESYFFDTPPYAAQYFRVFPLE